MPDATLAEWSQLARAALIASVRTLREAAGPKAGEDISRRLHSTADYAESILDQAPALLIHNVGQ